MSVDRDIAPAEITTLAVAVKSIGGKGSRRAVRWAVEKLMPRADRFVLIHVIPTITSIPTPSGDYIPVEDLDANVVAMYVQDMKAKFEEIFIPFKRLSKTRKMETLVLEGENPALALVNYISNLEMRSGLVLGSCSSCCVTRKLKGPGVPEIVLKYVPDTCDVYVVSKRRLITNSANPMVAGDCEVHKTFGASSMLDHSYPNSQAFTHESFSIHSTTPREGNHQNIVDSVSEIQALEGCPSLSSACTEQSDVQAEVEKLRLELQNTVAMYNLACEDLVHAQHKVHLLSSECLEESKRVNAAMKREETSRKIAAEEKEKHLEALKEVDMARNLLAKEAYERQIAELKALKESLEKQKVVDALFLSDKRYRRYTREEIEVATDLFSETKMIGEGAYGKVYKCNLDHTPVAVKVLHPDASDKKEEFLREVEVLSQLRHPHMVLLLGACPDGGCLVYEYMENGSLEDHIFCKNGRPPLPWFVRFRVVFEVGCGLAFLHNSRPEPIIHRDLKPGNILLDRNYVSKIGDVGMAKLVSDIVPDNITEYRDSILAGTLYYMDPEYQRTGTVRPKSDLYAFGIIILQLLAARHPNGLLLTVENAIASSSFSNVLDKSVTGWPLAEAEELAQLALKCTRLRCRDRPDLETEVLPVLKKLAEFAGTSMKADRNNLDAPSHYYCPVLQEVMDEPQIAADGFTYEHRAIKIWLERHNVSPVTKLKLQHKTLTPNHTLRSAIQEWRSRLTSGKPK
ncbi:unnamed protein product [Ilex paraguariensis]|uniref:RING-type E3 ubiquitin transferase n=1 Tax=Ilex paraguariensis TaxID=185542 RepID=A0ABC8U645_9AQUA